MSNSPSSSNVSYGGAFIDRGTTSSQSTVEQRMPVAGTLDQFAVRIANDPGSSPNSWTFTVMNGVTGSAVTCAISGSSTTSCTDLTHAATFAAGDMITVRVTPNSDPDNATSVRWTARFTAQ